MVRVGPLGLISRGPMMYSQDGLRGGVMCSRGRGGHDGRASRGGLGVHRVRRSGRSTGREGYYYGVAHYGSGQRGGCRARL